MTARIEDGGPAEAGLVERLANSGHTPGPWGWFGNANSYSLYLATKHSGRRYVMGFKRWGMRGAQPQFQPECRGMVDASKLLKFEVGDRSVRGVEQAKADSSVYRYDVRGIDCPDARLIASAPELLNVAIQQAAEITRLRAENAGMLEALKPFAEVEPMNVYSEEDEEATGSYVLTENQFRRARAAISRARQMDLTVGRANNG